ncbi:SMP-30/gluconolactonase/LRE family protein [Pontixanthobacter sp. CEM42]|uniref:SMP-30/gluconolactonase/LRE family protein n=1 Tax=Pontixanthobacter sp. CEM42 TaxID=2792077 RepID=UPI001ADF3BCA|nr:SMP-30/gluconolactonase/LRE family protein [Pontixanthobacter sp. CEM42]
MLTRRTMLVASTALAVIGCSGRGADDAAAGAKSDFLEVLDPAFFDLVARDVQLEQLGDGYQWSEGPAWDTKRSQLYFTDVPGNVAYVWKEGEGVKTFLDPSGVGSDNAAGFREAGANGLLIGRNGKLLVCNHGRRAVEELDIDSGERTVLVDRFEGKAFNSPNDIIEKSDGTLFFTDPPYGLEGLNESPLKEMAVNGVYRRDPDGTVARIVDDMTFPNGAALSPDERYLYVAQSDPDAPLVERFDLNGDMKGEVWFDVAPYTKGTPGLPDGMAVATSGHMFLAGPGGVLLVDPSGKCLGRIGTGSATANCTFGGDGSTLFITAQDRLLRISTKATGVGAF